MNVVLLRVGIDSGCGGIHSPLFPDGCFEFLPIPDDRHLDERTYGNTTGRHGRPLRDYFPPGRQEIAGRWAMHVDPEFATFTYGDPPPLKRGLARLGAGDLLVFYAGMEGWGWTQEPAHYLVGYLEVARAGFAPALGDEMVQREFAANFHVRHASVYREQRDRLLLIRGGPTSRLYSRAVRLGGQTQRADGSYWQIISPEMAKVFGNHGGIGSIQRRTPRWIEPNKVERAAAYVPSPD